jgi:hypothetical protein
VMRSENAAAHDMGASCRLDVESAAVEAVCCVLPARALNSEWRNGNREMDGWPW